MAITPLSPPAKSSHSGATARSVTLTGPCPHGCCVVLVLLSTFPAPSCGGISTWNQAILSFDLSFYPSSFPALFVSPAWLGGLPRPLRARRHQGRAAYSRHVPLPPRRGMGTAAAERHQPRRQAEEKTGTGRNYAMGIAPNLCPTAPGLPKRGEGGMRRGSPSALLGRDAEGVNALPPRRGRPGTHLESGVLLHLQSH